MAEQENNVYIKKFTPYRVELSNGKILTADKSKNQEFDYDTLKKIIEYGNTKEEEDLSR